MSAWHWPRFLKSPATALLGGCTERLSLQTLQVRELFQNLKFEESSKAWSSRAVPFLAEMSLHCCQRVSEFWEQEEGIATVHCKVGLSSDSDSLTFSQKGAQRVSQLAKIEVIRIWNRLSVRAQSSAVMSVQYRPVLTIGCLFFSNPCWDNAWRKQITFCTKYLQCVRCAISRADNFLIDCLREDVEYQGFRLKLRLVDTKL